MDSPKSEPADATVADIADNWYRQALLAGVLAVIGAFFELGLWWDAFQRLPLIAEFWVSLLPVQGAGTAAALWICWLRTPRGERIPALFLRPVTLGVRWWWVGLGVPVFYGAMVVLTLLVALALRHLGYTPHGTPLLRFLRSGAPFTASLGVSLFTGILLVAPFTEEILFRVVLFESLRDLGDVWAAVASAFVFAAAHMIPEQFLALFFLGLVLQFLRLRTGSMLPCILVHAAVNTIGLVALLLAIA